MTESAINPSTGAPDADVVATCLVLMFKAPSRSKRRLAAEIGRLAATAAERLFACAHEDAAAWPGPVCYAPAGPEDLAWLEREIDDRPLVVLQNDGNLGARLNHVNAALAQRGIERQIFIGIDCPELDADYLRAAATALATSELVVGPARDGGAVLIGTRRPLPDLAPLPWSTSALEPALVERVERAGWTVARLAPLADVDTPEDLHAVAGRIAGDPRAARRALRAWVVATAPRNA